MTNELFSLNKYKVKDLKESPTIIKYLKRGKIQRYYRKKKGDRSMAQNYNLDPKSNPTKTELSIRLKPNNCACTPIL